MDKLDGLDDDILNYIRNYDRKFFEIFILLCSVNYVKHYYQKQNPKLAFRKCKEIDDFLSTIKETSTKIIQTIPKKDILDLLHRPR